MYLSLAKQARDLLRTEGDYDREIDFGVRFRIVEKDEDTGIVPPGTSMPPLVEVRDPYYLGGRFDTVTRKFLGPCHVWEEWYIGEKQFEILFGDEGTQHTLLYSAEGAGKTVLMSMWVWTRILLAAMAGISGTLGATAPTATRLNTFIAGVCDLVPITSSRDEVASAWGTLRLDAGEIATVSGHLIQFKSTKQQSAELGSPLQGYNFGLGCGMDEMQDSLRAYEDVIARLRAGAHSPIFGTATAKDSSEWRNFRDSLNPKYWTIERISYLDTPFVHTSHWEMMQEILSDRAWKRRGLALDVGPESALYPTFDRSVNLIDMPRIGVKDVTAKVLGRYGRNLHALLGHDPGSIQDVTEVLKAYQFPREKRHRWIVVGEFRTKRTTTEEHANALREYLQTEHGLQYPDEDEPKVLLRLDPYGITDSKTDRSVYLTFAQAGFNPMSAAYRPKTGTGNGRVPKEPRIEMVCSGLRNSKGNSWLYILKGEDGKPVAPLLVESFEHSERDAAGIAENVKKATKEGATADLSDPSVALGYALWLLERPLMGRPEQGTVTG